MVTVTLTLLDIATMQVQVLTVADSVHDAQVVVVPLSAHEMVPLPALDVAVSVADDTPSA